MCQNAPNQCYFSKPFCQKMFRLIHIVIALTLFPYTQQQFRMRLDSPTIGQAVELAHVLFEDEESEGISYRRDCRLLDEDELSDLFGAVQDAKDDTTARPNVLDAFSFLHSRNEVNSGAHGGVGFLPFHRVFLYLYEKLLRQYRPGVSLCFWDPTLEPEDYEQSEIWGDRLFGTARGIVSEGFAANWMTPVGPLIREVGRTGGTGRNGRTLNEKDIENVLSKKRLGEISFPNGRLSENVEELHNHVHLYIGGLMAQIETAAYDPIFWFYHVYVDCLFEEFREKQRNNTTPPVIDPELDWPYDYAEPEHAPFGPMRLGALRNIDGQNNFFSDRIRCEKVPSCRSDRDCGRFMNCRSRKCISNRRPRNRSNNNMFGGFMNGLVGPQTSNPMIQALQGMGMMGRGGFPGMGGNMAGMFGGGGGFPGMGGGFPGMPGMGGQGMPQMGNQQGRLQGLPGMAAGGSQGFSAFGGFPGMGGSQIFSGQGFPGMGGSQGFPGMGGMGGFPGMGGMGGFSMGGQGGGGGGFPFGK
ncbi:hypothetical protein LOTGIDRAFT_160808 [Lottia gigantea]|uniref:Tyrosinase copper-binding domain-containing protein n=1 Tax=Lottia gigantea TaxID=225164 RepID=V4AN59_LOTGI|nr:hypothetical protein LOTGIDRAFT_160808 [Lottia gigantea]ESO95046.1 hypothetical protein LOTGIDRAFT_160808 [Lottia gigantea]